MKSLFILYYFFIITACLTYPGCKEQKTWDTEFRAILEQTSQLDQSYANLNRRVDSLWDATTEHVRTHMPADMPPIEADIFLKSRNADHMRMFMSFKLLDSTTQAIVNKAGEMDQLLAKKILDVQQGRNSIENTKLEFLKKVEAEDKEAYARFRQKFVASAMASQE